MNYQFITSMTKPYFDSIGQVMIESWLKYWTIDQSELIIYGEDFTHNYKDSRVSWRDWGEFCKNNHEIFKSKAASKTPGRSITFAKKGFAFLDSMRQTKANRLIWVDADILFYKEIDEQKFSELLTDNKLIAFFDQFYATFPSYTREQYIDSSTRKHYGAESGFVILNPKHQNYQTYVNNYEDLYLNGGDDITHWFDSEVVVLAAKKFLSDVFDLSSLRTTNKTQTPLNRCWLSEYFNHQKGKSKRNYSQIELKKLCGLDL